LRPLEHPASAYSANRREQVVTLPQPSSPTGSSAHGVEVWAMRTIAAMQARSDPVRGATAGTGGWRRQQRLDALPQRIGQERVGE
jgi:hypothetical protein